VTISHRIKRKKYRPITRGCCCSPAWGRSVA
jgi:hypothetical protein